MLASPPLHSQNVQGRMDIWTHFWSFNTSHTNVSHSRARARFDSILNFRASIVSAGPSVLTQKMLPKIIQKLGSLWTTSNAYWHHFMGSQIKRKWDNYIYSWYFWKFFQIKAMMLEGVFSYIFVYNNMSCKVTEEIIQSE